MKILLRTGIVLLLMVIIGAGYWFVVNQTNIFAAEDMPVMTDGEMPERPEMDESSFTTDGDTAFVAMPDHDEAFSSRGFSELLTILLKLTVIAAFVILLQVTGNRINKRNKLNQITEQV